MIRAALGVSLLAALATPADGRIFVTNARVDHALDAEHANTSLLEATITSVRGLERPGGDLVFVEAVGVSVDRVLLDRAWNAERNLELGASSLRWPTELVEPIVGAPVLLLVRTGWRSEGGLRLEAVLPRLRSDLPTAETEAEAVRVVEGELLTLIEAEGSPERLAALLTTAAPILDRSSADRVRPLQMDADPGVGRAARGAIMLAEPGEDVARLIAADVEEFFATGPGRDCLGAEGSGCSLRQLYRSYPFLDPDSRRWGSRWSEAEARRYEELAALVADRARLPAAANELLFPEQERERE